MWSTGIFWRNDKISDDIASMSNPYDIFWNGAPPDKTHLLANAQDVLAMPMFRDGMTDVNVTDPATITKAKDDVAQVVSATNASFDHVDYTDVPKGQAYLHQSWSGNVSDAFVFLEDPSQADNLSYVWPVESGVPGNVDNDLLIVLNSGKNPVLSHLLVNHIMDADNAMTNFATWTGYQMPQKSMTRQALDRHGPRARASAERLHPGSRHGSGIERVGAAHRRERSVAIRIRRAPGGCLARPLLRTGAAPGTPAGTGPRSRSRRPCSCSSSSCSRSTSCSPSRSAA